MAIARVANIAVAFNFGGSPLNLVAYNQPANQHITVAVTWEGTFGGVGPTGVTDTAGNTYVARSSVLGTDAGAQLWDAVAPCLGNASNVIAIAFPAGNSFLSAGGARYSATTNKTAFLADSIDGDGGAPDNLPATGVPFSAGNFAVAVVQMFSGTTASSANAGWTIQINDGPNGILTIDRIDTPGGTITAGATLNLSSAWVIVAASYVEVAASTIAPMGQGSL
jgi:hypothetical protein